MEDRETTRILMATVPHVTSGLGLRKFQADGFLLTRVYVKYGMVRDKNSLDPGFLVSIIQLEN